MPNQILRINELCLLSPKYALFSHPSDPSWLALASCLSHCHVFYSIYWDNHSWGEQEICPHVCLVFLFPTFLTVKYSVRLSCSWSGVSRGGMTCNWKGFSVGSIKNSDFPIKWSVLNICLNDVVVCDVFWRLPDRSADLPYAQVVFLGQSPQVQHCQADTFVLGRRRDPRLTCHKVTTRLHVKKGSLKGSNKYLGCAILLGCST